MGGHAHNELDTHQVEVRKDSLWSKLPIIGVVCAVVGFAGAFIISSGNDPISMSRFWSAYVTAFVFALAIGLGGMFFVILQHITRAQWSIVLRRLAEGLMISVPFVMLAGGVPLFLIGGGAHHDEHHEVEKHHDAAKDGGDHHGVLFGESCSEQKPCVSKLVCEGGVCAEKERPLFPGSHHIYEWTHLDVVMKDPLLKAKTAYLNESSQKTRYFFYLIVWSLIAGLFWNWSTKQDGAVDPVPLKIKQRWSSPLALLFYALTVTFFAFDVLMSLDPHWFSTIFGIYYFTGATLTVHALLVVIVVAFQATGYLRNVVTVEHFHDLGKFMFGFTVFWAYIAFSQYFLIWYAAIPEETGWYRYRGHGDWMALSLVLVLGRFVLPWFALLRQPVKRTPKILLGIAMFIIAMEYVDLYWLVMPAFDYHQSHYAEHVGIAADFHGKIGFTLGHVLTLLGFCGIVVAAFGWAVSRFPLVPLKDPRLQESLDHENR